MKVKEICMYCVRVVEWVYLGGGGGHTRSRRSDITRTRRTCLRLAGDMVVVAIFEVRMRL